MDRQDMRIEAKFIGPDVCAPHIEAWIYSNDLLFYKSYADRWVNNIYFDTPDLCAYEENLSGISERTKLRYRWYGELYGSHRGSFEIKRKRNNLGYKLRFPLQPQQDLLTMRWVDCLRLLQAMLPNQASIALQQTPFPILINRYRRYYYESADGTVRATIDRHLVIWDQRYTAKPNLMQHSINMPRQTIVELKFQRERRECVTQILKQLPLRMTRCSKYVNGVRSIL